MNNELVRYSRAGDEFHYRWAARRCLNLVHPKSTIRQLVIEGSLESKKPGEYVIDVAEYYLSEEIKYYQLKHTTVKKEIPFNLSDLKDTFRGFAQRYYADMKANTKYIIVTNRLINSNLKEFIVNVANEKTFNQRYMKNFLKFTGLPSEVVKEFCSKIIFQDYEGDYGEQKYQLHMDLAKIIPGNIDNALIDNVKSMVQSKVLPDSDGVIYREDLLKLFGVISEYELFPAPVEFEVVEKTISINQTQLIKEHIFEDINHLVVHAAGGVGKTTFARELSEYPSENYIAIIYDCFGGGRYRNISESRHQHRIALTQIVNELALKQLCDPMIIPRETPDYAVVRSFLDRIKQAVKNIKSFEKNKNLLLIIDAADNSVMAAEERNENSFVKDLLNEEPIEGFKIIATSRTERVSLLNLSSQVQLKELFGFSEKESFQHLARKFPTASELDGIEFHRLTNGNPRVQSNSLIFSKSLKDVFHGLMDIGNTVNEQINAQLNKAINSIKDGLTDDYSKQIDNICIGLATLPPFVPLDILSNVSNVDKATLKSFASELGKSLWILDEAIQFRDEPTETWFREQFVPNKTAIELYISRLLPISNVSVYVAMCIPYLLLSAERYQELINIALTEEYLPDNALDKRNVKLYRLKYAFKASLKMKKYADATKLAMLAGEESAGDQRQLELIKDNMDLIKPLMNKEYVQEIAFKKIFKGDWRGSEQLYSASLLSSVPKYQGESKNFLRSATNWLEIYLSHIRNHKIEGMNIENKISIKDITEYIFTYLNLYGVSRAAKELMRWQPKHIHFEISNNIFKRLIDMEAYELINEFAGLCKLNPYVVIAYVYQMDSIGEKVDDDLLEEALTILNNKRTKIKKPALHDYEEDIYSSALLTYLEYCLKLNYCRRKILRALTIYFDMKLDYRFGEHASLYRNYRDIMMRKIILQIELKKLNPNDIIQFISQKYLDDEYNNKQKVESIKSDFLILLPWYELRLNLIRDNNSDRSFEIFDLRKRTFESIEKRYKSFDVIPYEISKMFIRISCIIANAEEIKIREVINNYLFESKYLSIDFLLEMLFIAFRNRKLDFIKYEMLSSTISMIDSFKFENIQEKAQSYIKISRAICNKNIDDASVFFNMAIEMVSKFGDEIVSRWNSIVKIAENIDDNKDSKIAYRFIRCAEVVGENVYREKYWNRQNAVITSGKLSLPITISALSRWRDRNVGDFDILLFSLLAEMIKLNKIEAKYAWSFRSFLNPFATYNLGVICVEREVNVTIKQNILDDLVNHILINGLFNEENIDEIRNLAKNNFLRINQKIYNQSINETKNSTNSNHEKFKENEINYNEILQKQDFVTIKGIEEAIEIRDSLENYRFNNIGFWRYIISEIPNNKVNEFLKNLVDSKKITIYDLQNVLSNFPIEWTMKVSLKQFWPQLMRMIGNRFAKHLTNEYYLDSLLQDITININNKVNLFEGVLEGISNHSNLNSAEEYFGIINNLTHYLSNNDSTKLLDFCLSRFEVHVESDFSNGDINYIENREDIFSIEEALAGLLLSALGSPNSETRWRAIHVIKNLTDYNLKKIMLSISDIVETRKIENFVDVRFPLYDYHITQHLLVALQRISVEKPTILLEFTEFLKSILLDHPPHVLIQRLAAKTVLNIEAEVNTTFSDSILHMAKGVFEDKLQILEINKDKIKNLIESCSTNESIKHYFGYDIERYWFERLGSIFGLTEGETVSLANYVVNNHFHNYKHVDERNNWNIYNYEETDHSHGSYPKVDNYNFYVSYHCMFIVAALLSDKLAIVEDNWYENPWEHWLSNHELTAPEMWLSEYREAIPNHQNNWSSENPIGWLNEFSRDDFAQCLLNQIDGEQYITVRGNWNDVNKDKQVSVSIYSALVEKESSIALLDALNSCENPYDYKLPDYQEDMEITFDEFKLVGWLNCSDLELELDKKDPFAKNILFPMNKVGGQFSEILEIQYDSIYRRGYSLINPKAKIKNEIWYKDDSEIRGNIMNVSLEFIKLLLEKTNLNLIIEVQIRKQINNAHFYGGSDKIEYSKPKSRVFLFAGTEGYRDSEIYYRFRQKDSE